MELLDKEALVERKRELSHLINPTRIDILNLLIKENKSLTNKDMYVMLGKEQSFISQHTTKLKEFGFVYMTKVGRKRFYSLTGKHEKYLVTSSDTQT